MQRKVILLFIFSLLALNAYTQGFKGGLHAGLLATQVDGDNHAGYKKAGLFAGVFTNYSFADRKILLQFELNYAQKGSSAAPVYRMKLQQVEPTALLGWKFWNKFLLEGGLSCSILASAKEYGNQGLYSSEDGSNFYRVHVEWIGGLGYCFQKHWIASFRFIYSTPIGTTNKWNSGIRQGVEGYMCNNCLLFRLSYQF